MESYTFPAEKDAPGLDFEGEGHVDAVIDHRQDVTGMALIPDGGDSHTLVVSKADGRLVRLGWRVDEPDNDGIRIWSSDPDRRGGRIRLIPTAQYAHSSSHIIGLTSSGQKLLTISTGKAFQDNNSQLGEKGTASLFNARSPWTSPETLDLGDKPRSAHICLEASTPYAAIGFSANLARQNDSTSQSPSFMSIFAITENQFQSTPLLRLGGTSSRSSAVYAIIPASPYSRFGGSHQVLLSGWFDGHVRVHDLRSNNRMQVGEVGNALKPVLSMRDPWLDAPVYSLGMGGGHNGYVVAGMGQHGILAIYDVRNPMSAAMSASSSGEFRLRRNGYSVYSPGGNHTPVYSLKVEGTRIWGTTTKAFMLDFGPTMEARVLESQGGRWLGPSEKCTTYLHTNS